MRMVHIQRSRGYSLRPSLRVEDIGGIIRAVRSVRPDAVVFVDNEIARREVGEGLQLFAVRGRFFGRYLALGFFDEQLPLC